MAVLAARTACAWGVRQVQLEHIGLKTRGRWRDLANAGSVTAQSEGMQQYCWPRGGQTDARARSRSPAGRASASGGHNHFRAYAAAAKGSAQAPASGGAAAQAPASGGAGIPAGLVTSMVEQYSANSTSMKVDLRQDLSLAAFENRLRTVPVVTDVRHKVKSDGASRKSEGNHWSEYELELVIMGFSRTLTAAVTKFDGEGPWRACLHPVAAKRDGAGGPANPGNCVGRCRHAGLWWRKASLFCWSAVGLWWRSGSYTWHNCQRPTSRQEAFITT